MNDACDDCAGAELSLSTCDVTKCEAMCCYDGAYVEPQEEAFLTELVARVPALQAHLPPEFIVEGYWFGEHLGRKTATRAHAYQSAQYPAHFAKTRCVFADGQGFCELEKLARSRGQHPWTYKPAVCWLFPLQEVEDEPQPELPPVDPLDDPQRQDGYPGYATVVHCGRHDVQGKPWRDALTGELAYLARAQRLPLLGSPGNTVDDLLRDQIASEAPADTPPDRRGRARTRSVRRPRALR